MNCILLTLLTLCLCVKQQTIFHTSKCNLNWRKIKLFELFPLAIKTHSIRMNVEKPYEKSSKQKVHGTIREHLAEAQNSTAFLPILFIWNCNCKSSLPVAHCSVKKKKTKKEESKLNNFFFIVGKTEANHSLIFFLLSPVSMCECASSCLSSSFFLLLFFFAIFILVLYLRLPHFTL